MVLIVSACSGAGDKGYTVVAILTVTPTSFSLGESKPFQIITLSNTGTAPVTSLTMPTLTAAPLTESATTCTAVLAVGASCDYIVAIDYSQSVSAGSESLVFSYNNGQQAQTANVAAEWSAFSPAPAPSPAKLQLLLAQSSNYSCALNLTIGEVKCWGYNLNGELGNGTNTNTGMPTPILIGGQSDIPVGTKLIAVSAGTSSSSRGTSCVISESNKLYCWGDNTNGALGNGTTTDSNVAKVVFTSADSSSSQLPANAKIVYVSSNNVVTCALDSAGNAYCWGRNVYGALGNGTIVNSAYPVLVAKGGSSAIPVNAVLNSISAGAFTTCATDISGNAYCWGSNASGALGDGTIVNSAYPVLVAKGGSSAISVNAKITQISSSKDDADQTTCAVADGRAYCWGYSGNGATGNNETSGGLIVESYPIAVNAGINGSQLPANAIVTNIVTAYAQTCAIADGKAYCWGQNWHGQLGDATTTASYVPVAVVTSGSSAIPSDVKLLNIGTAFDDVTANGYSSCAMGDNLEFYCWGDNTYGELGVGSIGTPPYSSLPLKVLF